MLPRLSAHVALFALAAALAVPSSADAQTPRVYCPWGAPNCFGLKYELVPYADAGNPILTNRFTFWLQNLQGSYWQSGPDPDPFLSFGIRRNNPKGSDEYLGIGGSTDPKGVPEGNVAHGDFISVDLQSCSQDDSCSGVTWQYPDGLGGFHGCAVPPHPLYGWQTCPRNGLDGWVRFDLLLGFGGCCSTPHPAEVTLEDFRFQVQLASGAPASCQLFGENANLGYPLQVCPSYNYALTPEPSTAVLLGSVFGVFGIASAFRRRHARSSRRTQ